MQRPALVAFDVNETLLSLQPLREAFSSRFGQKIPIGEWFARLLHGSTVANIIGPYRPFDEIGVEAMVSLAGLRGIDLDIEEARSLVGLMDEAPPHPDVVPAIERMASKGVRMVALTNGSTPVANAQIDNAGLRRFMERVISVDEVRRFKPDRLAYEHAAGVMATPLEDMTLVAAHDWDCAGAQAAGAGAVFVARPGAGWSLPVGPPENVVSDLGELADLLS